MNNVINVEWTMMVVFIVLKLTGIITWSWWWIALILTFDLLVVLLVVLLAFIIGLPFVLVAMCKYIKAILS
tara:strand:+ start:457 stop:669 length:213 start_codon:yes stop_codon:yes gene_type:complete